MSDVIPISSRRKTAEPPPLLLGEPWDQQLDLTGWWMSEKLDGVRAYWDGERFLSRTGIEYLAPAWFITGLPAHPLDGELWAGRGRFREAVGIARRLDRGEPWRQLRFAVFDAPAHGGLFEERLAFGRDAVDGAPHAAVLEQLRCEGAAHLQRELARVEALGGEGLMLRRPASSYEPGRGGTLLKVKRFEDVEATVLGYVAGAGPFAGMLGAIDVELTDSTRCTVSAGFSEDERRSPPAIGAKVIVRCRGGSPATYVGLREES